MMQAKMPIIKQLRPHTNKRSSVFLGLGIFRVAKLNILASMNPHFLSHVWHNSQLFSVFYLITYTRIIRPVRPVNDECGCNLVNLYTSCTQSLRTLSNLEQSGPPLMNFISFISAVCKGHKSSYLGTQHYETYSSVDMAIIIKLDPRLRTSFLP